MSQFKYKHDGDEEIILSKLLKEIKDKSLQTILRRVIFSGENVKDVVSEERPETTQETKTASKY